MEMLKVSAKSARRVKPRRVWLELASETPEDGELGLEVGIGVVGGQDVRLCWEKNGGALGMPLSEFPAFPVLTSVLFAGFARSANYASIPLSRIRDLRFASAGAPYRTSLHLAPNVEPRWLTIIYAVPAPSSFLGNVTGSPAYKLVHFISSTTHELELWQKTLESFKEGRLAKGLVEGEGEETAPHCGAEKDKVVKEEEVHQLCSRLGMGMSRGEIGQAFRVRRSFSSLLESRSSPRNPQKSAAPNDFLDFRTFQNFVKLLKRRTDVETIFTSLVKPNEPGLDLLRWDAFLKDVQGVRPSSPSPMKTSDLPFSAGQARPGRSRQVLRQVRLALGGSGQPRRLRLVPHVVRQRANQGRVGARHDEAVAGVLHLVEPQRSFFISVSISSR